MAGQQRQDRVAWHGKTKAGQGRAGQNKGRAGQNRTGQGMAEGGIGQARISSKRERHVTVGWFKYIQVAIVVQRRAAAAGLGSGVGQRNKCIAVWMVQRERG